MSGGSYLGGSTVVNPSSGWFTFGGEEIAKLNLHELVSLLEHQIQRGGEAQRNKMERIQIASQCCRLLPEICSKWPHKLPPLTRSGIKGKCKSLRKNLKRQQKNRGSYVDFKEVFGHIDTMVTEIFEPAASSN